MLIPRVRARASFSFGEMVVPFRKGGRLLEIGCGAGFYLAHMRMLGWSVWGIEVDPVAADVAAKYAGCQVHVGTLEDAPFEADSFDVIVSHHVIEHVYDPKAFVSSAGRLLSKGGLMAVQTPNFRSLGHRLFGADIYSLDPPRHLCLFSPGSMQTLFEDSGLFSDVRTTTLTGASSLAIRRRYAVRETGNFLGDTNSGGMIKLAELLFCATEALGNRLFHWGEDIFCRAIKT